MASNFNIAELIGKPSEKQQEFIKIPLEKLHKHQANAIFPINDGEVEQLADSIELNGLQQPPLVTPDGDGYTIISGHRRVRAVKLLKEHGVKGWDTLTCKVQKFASPELAEIALLTANTETRRDKSWMVPAAKRYEELCIQLAAKEQVKLPKFSLRRLADAIGVKKSELSRQTFIAEHTQPEVNARFKNLPTATAYAIASLTPTCQRALAKYWSDEEPPRAADIGELKLAWESRGISWFADFFKQKEEVQRKAQEEVERMQWEREARRAEELKKAENAVPQKQCYAEYVPKSIPTSECCAVKCGMLCCIYCPDISICDHICESFKKGERWQESTIKDLENTARLITVGELVGKPMPQELRTLGSTGSYSAVRYALSLAKKHNVSLDFLFGYSKQMFRIQTGMTTADGIETGWHPLTRDNQPPEGSRVAIMAYNGYRAGYETDGVIQAWRESDLDWLEVDDLKPDEALFWAFVPADPMHDGEE